MDTDQEIIRTDAERKKDLFLQQKKTLETFLGTGAITQAQYSKSLNDLTEKMGFQSTVKDANP